MSHSNKKSIATGLGLSATSLGAIGSPSSLADIQHQQQQQQQHHPDQTAFHYPPHQQATQHVASSSHLGSNRATASAPIPPFATSANSAMSGLDQTPKKGDFNIQLQQATPTIPSSSQQQLHNMSNLPNTLLPGASSSSRPSTTATTYSAPQTIPTMPPPINTNQQQYTPRPPTLNPQHSHSRSSPAGLDQKYIAFSTTPTKPYNSVTPSSSHSPLGLADIRPRTNSDLLNRHGSQSAAMYDYAPSQTNCSYVAPWTAYAFDWCKWPVPNGNSCGKMAIGSYLEDPHNFVRRNLVPIHPTEYSY
jgi:WD repeat-containing protein 68